MNMPSTRRNPRGCGAIQKRTVDVIALLGAVLAGAILLTRGCVKQAELPDRSWSKPVKFAESWEGLVDSAGIFRHNHRIGALIPQRTGVSKCLFLHSGDGNNSYWTEVPIKGVPYPYRFIFGSTDQPDSRMWFQAAFAEDEHLSMGFIAGSLTAELGLRISPEKKWALSKKALLGETGTNVTLLEPFHGSGVMRGTEIYIPYCLDAVTRTGNTQTRTHFNNGVFRSDDSGKTWQMEQISDFEAGGPTMTGTKGFYYFFAEKGDVSLWFSKKPIGATTWATPEVLVKSYARGLAGRIAASNGDTVHFCWLDSRHEKMRFNLMDPYRGNYEVAYRRRRDADASWGKDVILSKGLFYSYSPSMSVEGDRIVVAWAGVKKSFDWHSEHRPNDIYYVTSKDAGISWTKPLKATDSAKDGITSGRPQVAMLNGVIHLLYVQGKVNYRQESPGLVKLNQPPWPIYHQQRPFPE